MLVQELLTDRDAAIGTPVTISGRVVITWDDRAFLTFDAEAFERGESLFIRDGGGIAEHLQGMLPSYVGGPFIYYEECVLTGTIERASDSFRICDLSQCKVRRDDSEFDVPVGG